MEKILKEAQDVVVIDDTKTANNLKLSFDKIEEVKDDDDGNKSTITSEKNSLTKPMENDKVIVENNETEDIQIEKKKINFSSFEIISKIGEGAFGKVYKVKLIETGEIYAMKSISKEYLAKTKQTKYATGECNILRNLEYPFLIKMHYTIQTPSYIHIILDLCEGGCLLDHIEDRHMFEESEAKFYIAELILAIEYLHSKNIIYRDLKPENVLICILVLNL